MTMILPWQLRMQTKNILNGQANNKINLSLSTSQLTGKL